MKIGVFDSGYGGLTILRAIRQLLPGYDYLYLGDNARAPYGTHSFDVIYQYTLEAVRYLISRDCALIILACNTASAKALRSIQQRDLPIINAERLAAGKGKVNVLGVIRPTIETIPALTRTGHIGVLATPATVSSESYVLELSKHSALPSVASNQSFVVSQQACPLWVPLIEAGEHLYAGADYFVDLYLKQLFERDSQIDTVVLGCTHYPLLLPKIEHWLHQWSMLSGQGVHVVAQGALVADRLADYLRRHSEYNDQLSTDGTCLFLTTENADRFIQSASAFLGSPVQATRVQF